MQSLVYQQSFDSGRGDVKLSRINPLPITMSQAKTFAYLEQELEKDQAEYNNNKV